MSATDAEGSRHGIPRGKGGLGDGELPGIGAVDSLPVPVHQVSPGYPARARRKGVGGMVLLSCLVGADGRSRCIEVVRSEPEGVFEDRAVAALKQWRFRPAMRDGRAVEYRIRVPFRFDIH
ncbi:energy transducer TonB [Salidesulfovibrio onnuriiensis]|uniref:energy transducer TonB n=1 Tax=Salidesulfovibrio onnuriiensis TaxID=2583823 RepID=UPI00164FD351|nr:energy transducer TonB [Salidesulfovibrio onnuriiensis]